jgi:hypothetical protein
VDDEEEDDEDEKDAEVLKNEESPVDVKVFRAEERG